MKFILNKNLTYVIGEKIIKIIYSLSIGIFIIRSFDVEEAGLFAVLMSYFSIMQYFASAGLNELNIINLQRENNSRNYKFNTYFLQISFATIISVIVLLLFKNQYDSMLLWFLCLAVIVRFNNVNRSELESLQDWKAVFFKELKIISLVAIARLIGLYFNYGIEYFIASVLFESICYLIFFGFSLEPIIQFQKNIFRIVKKEIYPLLKDSIPLLLQGFCVIIIMKMDMIYSSLKLTPYDIGIYGVGIKISESLYFVPMALGSYLLPKIAKSSNNSLLNELILFLKKYLYLFYALILFIFTFSEIIITSLFGLKFSNAALILKIHIISVIFVFIGVVGDKYYLTQGNVNILFLKTLISGIIYCFLLIILPPSPVFVAFSVVVFQIVNSYLIDLCFKEGRKLFLIKTKSILYL